MHTLVANLAQEMVLYGTIGAFGGTAHYVYQAARNGRPFRGWGFIANVILSFLVSWGFTLYLDGDANRREFYALVTGFLAYPILDVIDEYKSTVIKRLKAIKRID